MGERKNRYFEKFIAKVNLINPNISFKEEDWIACKRKIKGYCNLHKEYFEMYKIITYSHNNCPKCKEVLQYSKEEIETMPNKFKEIDKKFKENRKKDAGEKYARANKDIRDNTKLFKSLKQKEIIEHNSK